MQHRILNNIINFQEMQYLLRGLKNFLFNLCIRNILYAVFQVYFFRRLGIYNEFLQPLSAAASERRIFCHSFARYLIVYEYCSFSVILSPNLRFADIGSAGRRQQKQYVEISTRNEL